MTPKNLVDETRVISIESILILGLVRNGFFTTKKSNIGSPQGCVLSPLLYILYTDSCKSANEGSSMIKFSDETVLLSDHGRAPPAFIERCDKNHLDLNVPKPKQ
ncbi:hypothetical protein NL108_016520 [Boleophthalmus pectinirostris]|nr:hypothetical protein NL108_016520 [Boleophthalmus pectinirostris]